jgi:hypothetical protein
MRLQDRICSDMIVIFLFLRLSPEMRDEISCIDV